jgi:hypothetical protein
MLEDTGKSMRIYKCTLMNKYGSQSINHYSSREKHFVEHLIQIYGLCKKKTKTTRMGLEEGMDSLEFLMKMNS